MFGGLQLPLPEEVVEPPQLAATIPHAGEDGPSAVHVDIAHAQQTLPGSGTGDISIAQSQHA